MISHQLQTAKQRFSFVAGRAAKGAPRLVTKHGKPFVVIVRADDWQVRTASKRPLWEALRACPVDLNELQISRSIDLPRKVVL
jgi:prevent-host-death family protein